MSDAVPVYGIPTATSVAVIISDTHSPRPNDQTKNFCVSYTSPSAQDQAFHTKICSCAEFKPSLVQRIPVGEVLLRCVSLWLDIPSVK